VSFFKRRKSKSVPQNEYSKEEQFMILIALQCRFNKTVVRVADLLESFNIDANQLNDYISFAEQQTKTKASIVEIDGEQHLAFS